MKTKKTETSNLARFGWDTGQLSYIDDQGNKVRIGDISPEDQKIIDEYRRKNHPRKRF